VQEVLVSINKAQFRDMVEEVLKYLEPEIPYSFTAVELLVLTAATESHLGTYLKQVGGGPAKGVYQMEPDTADDIWENYLAYREPLAKRIESLVSDYYYNDLAYNLVYQTAMVRVHYFRVPESLPPNTPQALAEYWRKYYNTHLGKGTVEKAVADYLRLAPL